MDYTIYVDVSASGYISGTGNCKFQLSPPPNYTWVILIPAISIIAGGGYYYNKKRKRAPPPPPKPPKKKDECDDCFIFRLSPANGVPRRSGLGTPHGLAGSLLHGDGLAGRSRPAGSFRVVGGEEVGATIGVIGFNVQFGPHLGFQLDVNGQNAPADDYYITVTADGTSKTGRPCHGEQTVMLHVCGKVICDDGPFFMEEPDVTGDVERTDSAGNTEKLTGSSRPFGPGDRVQTFSDGFFEQSFEHFLAKGYGGGKVGEAALRGKRNCLRAEPTANWIDPLSKAPVPWLRMPEAEQLQRWSGGLAAELGAIIGLEAGKMLLNWKEADKNMTATVLLPRSPAADHGWAARHVNGTRLLVEATRDGKRGRHNRSR